jgi:hypothetical protein
MPPECQALNAVLTAKALEWPGAPRGSLLNTAMANFPDGRAEQEAHSQNADEGSSISDAHSASRYAGTCY